MSLINDALKRAESEKRAARPSGPPLQPAESTPARGTSPLLLGGIFLLALGAIAIAAALWFGGRTTQVVQTTSPTTSIPAPASETAKVGSAVPADRGDRPAPVPSTAPTTQYKTLPSTLTTVTSTPAAIAFPIQQTTPNTVTNTASFPPKSTPKPVAATSSAPTTTMKSTASVTPPATTATPQAKPIRLQSIFYRLKNPTVILNGKTLGVGETVDGIKIVSIQRTSIEIVQNGKYRTLTLQD